MTVRTSIVATALWGIATCATLPLAVAQSDVFDPAYEPARTAYGQPDLQGFKLPFPNTAVDLAFAMRQNPSMRVLVQQGYYDLATPHLATEYFIDHLDIPDELKSNVEYATYEAGHMMYIHEPSMVKFKEDLARFLRGDE